IAQAYTPGRQITGTISRLQDKGVAVDLGNDIEGFVPLSQIGVTGLQNPADLFAEGDVLEMEVTEVDPENRRIVLNVLRVPKLESGEVIQPASAPARSGEAEASAEAPGEAPAAEAVEGAVAEAAPAVEEEAPAVEEEAPAVEAGGDSAEEPVAEAEPSSEPAAEAPEAAAPEEAGSEEEGEAEEQK